MAEHGAQDEEDGGRQAGLPAHFRGQEVDQPDGQQDPGEEQEGHRRAHRRDGDEGGQEGAQDAADGVAGPQGAHGLAVVLQAVHGVLYQGRGDGAQQEAGEDENHHAGAEGGDDKEVGVDGEHQGPGDAQR